VIRRRNIELNKAQAASLSDMLADLCGSVTRPATADRGLAAARKVRRLEQRARELKASSSVAPDLARRPFTAEQQVLRRLEKTFRGFFARDRAFPAPASSCAITPPNSASVTA
jgi:hypothetical protein